MFKNYLICSENRYVSVEINSRTMNEIEQIYPWLVENGYDRQCYYWPFEEVCAESAINNKKIRQETDMKLTEMLCVSNPGWGQDKVIDQYSAFLNTLFDLWLEDRLIGKEIFIREFENLAGSIGGGSITACGMGGDCTRRLRIHKDCMMCRWVSLCKGGCLLEAGEDGKSIFCQAYQSFYPKAVPGIIRLLRELNHRRYK